MIYGRSERLEEQADTGETQDSMEVCHARTLSGPRSASLRSLTAEDWGVNLGEGAWSPPVWALRTVPASWNETGSKSE